MITKNNLFFCAILLTNVLFYSCENKKNDGEIKNTSIAKEITDLNSTIEIENTNGNTETKIIDYSPLSVWNLVSDTAITKEFWISSIAYGNGRFIAVGYDDKYVSKIAYSDDNGETWTAVTDSPFDREQITDIVYGNDRFIAVDVYQIAYSVDGKWWLTVDKNTLGHRVDTWF